MPHKIKKAENIVENKINTNVPDNVLQSPNSIEEWEELQLRSDFDALDTRKRPDYKVTYKQDVKTEDVFLQVIKSEFEFFFPILKQIIFSVIQQNDSHIQLR